VVLKQREHGAAGDHQGFFKSITIPEAIAVSRSCIFADPLGGQPAHLKSSAPMSPQGLLKAPGSVPNSRKRRGVRHRFVSILSVSACAVPTEVRLIHRDHPGVSTT